MTICDDYASWDDSVIQLDDTFPNSVIRERDRRTELLDRAINNYLENNGYHSVSVTHDDLPDSAKAGTDKVTGDITFDDSFLLTAGRDEAFDTAFHELWHSMANQDLIHERLSDDENASFNELEDMEGFDGEERARYVVPEHEDADLFGEYMSGAIDDACGSPEGQSSLAAESASETGPEIDWGQAAGPDTGADGGEAVASDPSAGESGESLGDEEYYFEPLVIEAR